MRASGACLLLTFGLSTVAHAQPTDACRNLPSHDAVRKALAAAQAQPNGGLGFHMWATIVDRDGVVCVVAFTGTDRGDQWPGSRVISAQKANTANAFSLPKFALSTGHPDANLQFPSGWRARRGGPWGMSRVTSKNPAIDRVRAPRLSRRIQCGCGGSARRRHVGVVAGRSDRG